MVVTEFYQTSIFPLKPHFYLVYLKQPYLFSLAFVHFSKFHIQLFSISCHFIRYLYHSSQFLFFHILQFSSIFFSSSSSFFFSNLSALALSFSAYFSALAYSFSAYF